MDRFIEVKSQQIKANEERLYKELVKNEKAEKEREKEFHAAEKVLWETPEYDEMTKRKAAMLAARDMKIYYMMEIANCQEQLRLLTAAKSFDWTTPTS